MIDETAIFDALIANGINAKIAADIVTNMAVDPNYRDWTIDRVVARAMERRVGDYNITVFHDQAFGKWHPRMQVQEFHTAVFVAVRYSYTEVHTTKVHNLSLGPVDPAKIGDTISTYKMQWGDLPVDLGRYVGQVSI
jgi:hypothetical protein